MQDNESWAEANNSSANVDDSCCNNRVESQATGFEINEKIDESQGSQGVSGIETEDNEGDEIERDVSAEDIVQRVDPLPVREINVNIWSGYVYDWKNIDPLCVQQLEQGIINKGIRKEVVHKVISQMRQINGAIPCAVLRCVAQNIVKKYPSCFEDRKRGKKFGSGHTNLYQIL